MERNTGSRKSRLFAALVLVCIFTYLPMTVYAHGGGTDQYGGHHDYNNVSGLGDYHYHHGFPAHLHENGVCPYDYVDLTGQSSTPPSSGTKSGAATTQQLLDESIQRERETEQRAIAAENEAKEAQLLAEQMESRADRIQARLDELKRRSTIWAVVAGAGFLLMFLLLRRVSILSKADSLHIRALENKISFYEELFPRLKDIDNMPRDKAREYVRQERARRSKEIEQPYSNDRF